MGSLAALNTGAQWFNDAQQMQRQAEKDAWTAKQNARTQLEWDQADRANAAGSAAMEGDQAPDVAFDARSQLGLAPAASAAAPVSDGSYVGDGPDVPTPQNTLAPAPKAPAPTNTLADGQRRDLEEQMRMAKAVGGQKGFAVWQAAKQGLRKLKLEQDVAQLSSGILNASDAEYNQALTKLTADKRQEYEAVYDPRSKMTTLQLGSKKAELSRAQVAEYFAASYRLAQGDSSALADMEKVNAGLASQVQHNLKNLSTVADRNNQAGHYANQDANNATRTLIRGAGGIGGAGGTGGKGGKAPAQSIDLARSILTDSMEKSDTKAANPKAYTRAVSLLDGIYRSNKDIAPATAAAIAADAAEAEAAGDTKKVSLQISDVDGSINKVYVNPDYDGGQPFSLAQNAGTLKDFEARVGADGVKQAAARVLASMNEATRASYLSAARDPAQLKLMRQYVRDNSSPEALKANMTALDNRVKLIADHGPAPEVPTDKAVTKKPVDRALKTAFGLEDASYVPPVGSPAAKAQAVRAQTRGAEQAKIVQANQAQQDLSRQFQADSQSLAPLELLRKYDGLRAQLSAHDARALKAAEQKL